MSQRRSAERMAVDQRPTSFDDRVMQYRPGLSKLAWKFTSNREDHDDLVNDTIAEALANWRSFREDGGFWNWLAWAMRGVAQNTRQQMRAKKRTGAVVNIEGMLESRLPHVGANQEAAYDLSRLHSQLSQTKHGRLLLRLAAGDTQLDLANELGVSKQRVSQIISQQREGLSA